MLAALIARLKPNADSRSDLHYILWLAAALLSKALAVVLPPVVLLYDLLVRRRKFSDAFVAQIIPGLMALLLLLKTMSAQNSVMGGIRSHFDLSLLQILAVDSTILWRYVTMLAWPSDLCVLYNPPTMGIHWFVAVTLACWSVLGNRSVETPHTLPDGIVECGVCDAVAVACAESVSHHHNDE